MIARHLIVMSLISVLLAACTYRVLPSFAMQVQLHRGESPQEVLAVAQAYLVHRGYPREGRGGYDAINNTDTVVSYGSTDNVDIALGLDRSSYVPIRVTYNGPKQRGEARIVFNALHSKLAQRWRIKDVP